MGLDNRELTTKVSKFLRLYNEVASLSAFTRDLFMCSVQLLHLSFQALDVTNTPGYVIQVNNVPMGARQPLPYGYGPSGSPQTTDGQGG